MADSVKIDPLALQSNADKINRTYRNCITALSEMERAMNATKSYWKGSASNLYRSDFETKKKKCEEILGEFKKYPEELAVQAKIYLKTDKEASMAVDSIETIGEFTMK